MPIYEYRCLACSNQFELIVLSTTVLACPSCGATTLERELSLFAVSSEGTTERSREKLTAKHQEKSKSVQKEKNFYTHDDHHH